MLDPNPMNLMAEVNSAERFRDLHISTMDTLIQEYHGPYYRSDRMADAEPAPENHAYEWLALVTTKIVYDNPVVEVSSRHGGVPKDIILRMKHGLNQWAEMHDLWTTLLQVWYDCAFAFGVIRTTLQPMPGYKGFTAQNGIAIKPQWPVCKRVDPRRFVIDPRCGGNISNARFMGHVWHRDKEDLLKARGFNHDVIREISLDAGLDKIKSYGGSGDNGPTRKEIVGYELWVPEITLPEAEGLPGYHGTIYTLGVAVNGQEVSEPQWIRDPRPYYGPATGPYSMFGIYWVPGCIFPLSPLAATYEQVKELNLHATAASRGAASFKRFIGYNPSNPNAGLAAKHAQHGEVVPIDNLGDDLQEMNLGGVDPSQYEYLKFLRERRDRVTGLNDAARGNVAGTGTATEIADAASQRDNRMAFMDRMFQKATIGVLNKAGWFLFNSEFARFKLNDRAAAEIHPRPKSLPPESQAEEIATKIELGLIEDPLGLGNLPFDDRINLIREQLQWRPSAMYPHEDPSHAMEAMAQIAQIDYDELQLMIQPMSMQHVDQAVLQKRAQDQFQLVSSAAAIMPQTPWIKWPELFDQWGQAMNVRDFGEVLDVEILLMLQQQFLAQATGMMPGQGGPQPQPPQQGTPPPPPPPSSGPQVRSGDSGPRGLPSQGAGSYIQAARMQGRQASEAVRNS